MNTSYFHSVTKTRRNRGNITSIQDENGVIQRGHKNIADVVQVYFQKQYSAGNSSPQLYQEVFRGFQKRVTAEINMELTKPVTSEEIHFAIFDIGAHRPPGPDGFSAIFYQHY